MNKLYFALVIILQILIFAWVLFNQNSNHVPLEVDVEIHDEIDTTSLEYPYELKTEFSSEHNFSTYSNTLLDL